MTQLSVHSSTKRPLDLHCNPNIDFCILTYDNLRLRKNDKAGYKILDQSEGHMLSYVKNADEKL